MQVEQLVAAYPLLYHMAEDGSWPSIERHGLLSTQALLDLFEVRGRRRRTLLTERRPEKETIEHPRFGHAVIRDNKPISDVKLTAALTDMSLEEWYRTLNERVFLWLRMERLLRLLGARAYRDDAHTVIIADTAGVVRAHASRITLSPINTGSTAYRAMPRGSDTFRSVADYPYEARRKIAGRDAVVELSVSDGIRDITEHALYVERWKGDRRLKRLWSR